MAFWHFQFNIIPASPEYNSYRDNIYFHSGYNNDDHNIGQHMYPDIGDDFIELISSREMSCFDEFLDSIRNRYDDPVQNWGESTIYTKNGNADNNLCIWESEITFQFSLISLNFQDFFFIANHLVKIDVIFIFDNGIVKSINKPGEIFEELLNSSAFKRISKIK